MIGAPYYLGDLKRNPNLQNHPARGLQLRGGDKCSSFGGHMQQNGRPKVLAAGLRKACEAWMPAVKSEEFRV